VIEANSKTAVFLLVAEIAKVRENFARADMHVMPDCDKKRAQLHLITKPWGLLSHPSACIDELVGNA